MSSSMHFNHTETWFQHNAKLGFRLVKVSSSYHVRGKRKRLLSLLKQMAVICGPPMLNYGLLFLFVLTIVIK